MLDPTRQGQRVAIRLAVALAIGCVVGLLMWAGVISR